MWNIAAVIPVDKRIGSGGGGGGSNDSSSDDYDRITKVIIVSESKIETDQEQENEVRTKEERCAETPTPPLTLDVLIVRQIYLSYEVWNGQRNSCYFITLSGQHPHS
ncbi:uncharacterized protein LOC124899257 isoform X2 [Capsicum annuum]|nr:uncharacterized protein LOC124899257 isoform X2 [Capsicum annuum]